MHYSKGEKAIDVGGVINNLPVGPEGDAFSDANGFAEKGFWSGI
jgi:hypothetical protein